MVAQASQTIAKTAARGSRDANPAARILVVEDNEIDAKRVQDALIRVARSLGVNDLADVEVVTRVEEVIPFLDEDSIDIYFVDLKIGDDQPTIGGKLIGEYLIERIRQASDAGIIVYSSEDAGTFESRCLLSGADQCIGKTTASDTPDIILSTALALWRRIRPFRVLLRARAHADRRFLVGGWLFDPESRELKNARGNHSVRLSRLEYLLLRHLVLVDGHELDRDTYATYVLGRPSDGPDRRLDSLVTRMRTKLGESVQIVPQGGGYRLLSIEEIEQK